MRRCIVATIYELWDNASGNLIEDYDTEREALDDVLEEIATYGADAVQSWALLRDPGVDVGPVAMIASGPDLIRHAAESARPTAETARHD